MTLYFKALGKGRMSCHGGDYTYPPPGEWTPRADPVLCRSGYHLMRPRALLGWLHEELWIAEGSGDCVESSDGKIAWEQVRLVKSLPWDNRVARLFACDCAERALERERAAGREPRAASWRAIAVARRYAAGDATQEELSAAGSAAWSAARDAARSAAWSTARSTARDAARDAARSAAWDAARSAAWSAAWSATESAAWSAAWVWQTRRLMEHYLGVRLTDAPGDA